MRAIYTTVRRIVMTNLNPSMRLKVKRDTFFLPDTETSIYFRNNKNSFRMEGSNILQWIEKLMPMFNGEHTMQVLTGGLPPPYQKHVFDIASVLYKNEFVRDVSVDQQDHLSSYIKEKYQSQIEFLNNYGDSGAYRFQKYREMKVLAIGSGSIFISLISSLIESGLAAIQFCITDEMETHKERLNSLITSWQKEDSELRIDEAELGEDFQASLEVLIPSYDAVLYVSQQEENKVVQLSKVCEEKGVLFIPSLILQNIGIAGPIASKESKGTVASAYRRLHQSVFEKQVNAGDCNNVGSPMLANLISFELFKEVTGIRNKKNANQCYLLNVETLEGVWHSFFTHPLEEDDISIAEIQLEKLQDQVNTSNHKKGSWFQDFSYWTSESIGIFHKWEEGDLDQLPLSQCFVQTVDALSDGPARLLPPIICGALTHEGARREAGLRGVEAYVQSAVGQLLSSNKYVDSLYKNGYVGIGTGETEAECIIRGLQKCLDDGLNKQLERREQSVKWIDIGIVEDEYSRYLIQCIETMKKTIKIGIGEDVYGFPVAFIVEDDEWFAGTGVQMTQALCHALQKVIMHSPTNTLNIMTNSDVCEKKLSFSNVIIPVFDSKAHDEHIRLAKEILNQKQLEMSILDIQFDKAFHNVLAGVYGVLLREKVQL